MSVLSRFTRIAAGILFAGLTAGLLAVVAVYLYVSPQLPSTDALRETQYQVPLRVFSSDGRLIDEFGDQRRTPMAFDEFPDLLVKAFLAAEDDRFFEHPGVDYQGLVRAAINLIATGQREQGGSTITMQVARNFFLTRDRTFRRKIDEIFLALQIERELSKEEILELYFNKIFLGNRAYGVVSAAHTYFGRELDELSVAQVALIAGLPKGPSILNPAASPERAMQRRNYVLGRMARLEYITEEQYREALQTPVESRLHGRVVEVEAPWVAEMVRTEMIRRFGEEEAYGGGYRVYTSIDGERQQAANAALRQAVLAYDRRRGYRGTSGQVEELPPRPQPDATADGDAEVDPMVAWQASMEEHLDGMRVVGDVLWPAVVLDTEFRPESEDDDEDAPGAEVYVRGHGVAHIPWEGLVWARRYISESSQGPEPKRPSDVLAAGDRIHVTPVGDQWYLAQEPRVEGALVALDSNHGGVVALTGGFDFGSSKFNRVTQALRQSGSAFKPFLYAAALEQGYTAASIVQDAPVVFEDEALESTWRPENYSGRFFGPTRLREGLALSRNLVSIRLLQALGVNYTVDYVTRFGFEEDRLPRDLSLSLGSSSQTPLELTRAYAVFANGGFLIDPWFIERIEDNDGNVLFRHTPRIACDDCPAVVPEGPTPDPDHVVAERMSDNGESDRSGRIIREPVLEDGLEDEDGGLGDALDELPTLDFRARRVIDPSVAYVMDSMLKDVIRDGTGRRALQLGRSDVAGKTGTTNDFFDAWFSGYGNHITATAWIGFDQLQPLGPGEAGAVAAGPMWIDFMREALRGEPPLVRERPADMVAVRISPETGLLAASGDPDAIFEIFPADKVPDPDPGGDERRDRSDGEHNGDRRSGSSMEDLF